MIDLQAAWLRTLTGPSRAARRRPGFPDDLVAVQQRWTRIFDRLARDPAEGPRDADGSATTLAAAPGSVGAVPAEPTVPAHRQQAAPVRKSGRGR
ncbi:hypothetical protein OG765_01205 [Streptomyces sp. NBC_00555]|uniref:hypothetical protein n=1 Tax=Streptomyces sp. NBC_00555 TaxID=2903662 RepID=UPI002252D205|nr:hypothetical protein [Streptomyces sp. NBC_00555]MCX5009612.1 hypothetical protein [Streptomyces sp. NBC_00555]